MVKLKTIGITALAIGALGAGVYFADDIKGCTYQTTNEAKELYEESSKKLKKEVRNYLEDNPCEELTELKKMGEEIRSSYKQYNEELKKGNFEDCLRTTEEVAEGISGLAASYLPKEKIPEKTPEEKEEEAFRGIIQLKGSLSLEEKTKLTESLIDEIYAASFEKGKNISRYCMNKFYDNLGYEIKKKTEELRKEAEKGLKQFGERIEEKAEELGEKAKKGGEMAGKKVEELGDKLKEGINSLGEKIEKEKPESQEFSAPESKGVPEKKPEQEPGQ